MNLRAAALALLAPLCLMGCATTQTALPLRLAGLGTEPFWEFTLEGGTFGYTTPEMPERRTTTVNRSVEGDRTVLTGTFDGQPLRMEIHRDTCSDGMSDQTYPFDVKMTIEGRDVLGCAYPARRLRR